MVSSGGNSEQDEVGRSAELPSGFPAIVFVLIWRCR
jgi:hypothetical protein